MGSFHSGLKGLWIPYSCGYIPSDGDEKTEAQKRIGLGNAKQPARSKAGSEAQVLSQVALTLLTSKAFCWRVEGLKCVCSLCERTNHASSAGTVIYEIFRIGRLESSHAVLVSGMPTLAEPWLPIFGNLVLFSVSLPHAPKNLLHEETSA